MRMWMVNPKIMCKNHLLGEHRELHMLVGSINKKINLQGYVDNNCLETKAIRKRHKELIKEMKRRGWNHYSPLPKFNIQYLSKHIKNAKVDKHKSLTELCNRCSICKKNFIKAKV